MSEFDPYKLAEVVEKIRTTQTALGVCMCLGLGVIIGLLWNLQ